MNSNAQKWVAALRSGEYQQANNFLHIEDVGHCCLGVACDLAVKDGVPMKIEHRETTKGGKPITVTVYNGNTGILPLSVCEWLGLRAEIGGSEGKYAIEAADGVQDTQTLTALNDAGATFAEIANVIESEPEGLFIDE